MKFTSLLILTVCSIGIFSKAHADLPQDESAAVAALDFSGDTDRVVAIELLNEIDPADEAQAATLSEYTVQVASADGPSSFGFFGGDTSNNFRRAPKAQSRGNGCRVYTGRASYYGTPRKAGGPHDIFAGRRTASGAIMNPNAMTAAMRDSRLQGKTVTVTNRSTQRSAKVKVNDKGPYAGGRIIDVSYRAAESLGMIQSGTANVTVNVCGS